MMDFFVRPQIPCPLINFQKKHLCVVLMGARVKQSMIFLGFDKIINRLLSSL